MTNPDVLFAAFVDANPVPDIADLEEARPDVGGIISGDAAMRREVQPAPAKLPHRVWVAAAALLIVLSVGGLLVAWPGRTVSQPATEPSPEESLRQEAVSAVEHWLAVLNAGDIEQVMTLSSVEARNESDRRVHEWLAGFAAHGMPVEVQTCGATPAAGGTARVECDVRLSDPVADELGVADLVAPFGYGGGLVGWQPYVGGDISAVNDAYATYLRSFDAARYEAWCSPTAYAPGSVVQDRGLALTGECAQLAAPLAGAVAEWIRGGGLDEQP